MLRIDINRGTEATTFTVEGKLMGRWAIELEKCWQSEVSTEPCRSILLNLATVTFVDSRGRELLTRMRREGVRLVPTGCLMKTIVEEIEAEVLKGKPL